MTRNELQAIADSRRKHGAHPASDPALMVLLLMETEDHSSDYCAALGLTWSTTMNQVCDMMNTAVEREIYAK